MKILLTAVLTLTLMGCGSTPQRYDNNEHEMLTRLAVGAEELNILCAGDSVPAIKYAIQELDAEAKVIALYSKYTPKNAEVHTVAKILANDLVELKIYYNTKLHNVVYCQAKTNLIYKKADRILQVIPTKKR